MTDSPACRLDPGGDASLVDLLFEVGGVLPRDADLVEATVMEALAKIGYGCGATRRPVADWP